MTKSMTLTITNPAAGRPLALHAARALGAASRMLERLAARLGTPVESAAPFARAAPMLEFHAEAGAPEGALYFNGERVGTLHGVTRL